MPTLMRYGLAKWCDCSSSPVHDTMARAANVSPVSEQAHLKDQDLHRLHPAVWDWALLPTSGALLLRHRELDPTTADLGLGRFGRDGTSPTLPVSPERNRTWNHNK